MNPVSTITFRDADTADEAVVIVRRKDNVIALGISVKFDGDIEVFMYISDAEKLCSALTQALQS